MESIRMHIEGDLNALRELMSSDFSALAWMESHELLIRWKFSSGRSNEKYKRIELKPGRGLAGSVIRLGREVVLDTTIPNVDRIRFQYTIMLAEQLQSVVAVPVFVGGEPRGVLLVGSRSERMYPKNEIEIVKSTAKRMALIIQQCKIG